MRVTHRNTVDEPSARRLRRGIATAAVLAIGLLVAACSSTPAASEGARAPENTNEATGTPVKIGLLNPVLGPVNSLGPSQGAQAALAYVNGSLAGIDDHPIELVSCDVDILSPESNINCANQFAQSGVVAVIDAFNPTGGATLPILQSADIPLFGPAAFDPTAMSGPEGRVYFAPASAAFLVGTMQSLKDQGHGSVTLANLDDPSGHEVVDQLLLPLGEGLGLDVTGVYFSPNNPNFTVLASTIKSTGADAAGLLVTLSETMCTKMLESLRSVGYEGVVHLAWCTEFIDELGADAVGAQLYSSIWLPQAQESAPDGIRENLELAESYVSAEDGPSDWYAYSIFAAVVDFARVLSAAAPAEYTGSTVLDALKATKDYQSFLGPVLDCGRETSPNCTNEFYVFEVASEGVLEPVGGGTVEPDEATLKGIPGAT